MALNDFRVKYTCKKCGSKMIEEKGIDCWGEHVYSWFRCSNPKCNNKTEDSDDEFYDKVIEIFTHY